MNQTVRGIKTGIHDRLMVRTSGFGPGNLGSNPSSRVKIGEAVLRRVQLFIHYMNCIYDFF